MAFGQCKDMSITFVNDTGLTVTVPREGHRVKNPGGVEGFNNLTLGGAVTDLDDGERRTTQQTLNIRCSRDAVFEIHYSGEDDRDFVQTFNDVNIEDKNATLKLTRH